MLERSEVYLEIEVCSRECDKLFFFVSLSVFVCLSVYTVIYCYLLTVQYQ